jgi:hypothetical protein
MTTGQVTVRLQRIYAALDAVLETDIHKAPPVVISCTQGRGIFQDFRGNQSDAEFENLAHSVIHNIANLRDHTRSWTVKSGKERNKKQVDEFLKANESVAVIQDLSNNDKHGYPPRDGGFSGKAPRLTNIRRIMRLTSGAAPEASVAFTIGPSGEQQVSGTGSATLIITADVQISDGTMIGDLHAIQLESLEAWEKFLREIGVLI